MNRNALISGRVVVGVLILVGLHLIAYGSTETWSTLLFWGSFVGVGLFVGMSSSRAFARGLVTALLGFLGSWAVATHVFGEVCDEREIFHIIVFLIPLTSILAGAAAAFGGWAIRGKNRIV